MANLLASLNTAARSMMALDEALAVVRNNVTNALTPGYVRQRPDLVALAFQPDLELPGGVDALGLISSRSAFSERAVWRQSARFGSASALASALGRLEPLMEIGAGAGVAGALDRLYAAFSDLTVTPNDIPARENVMRQAGEVAAAFRYLAGGLATQQEEARREAHHMTGEVNRLATVLRDLNHEIRQDYRKRSDAGLDARLHAALEELAEYVDFTVLPQEDGSYTVLLGGQTPLVIGDRVFEIAADTSGSTAAILDFNGQPAAVSSGRLAGVLQFANENLRAYREDLDRLAAALADEVNGVLAAGVDINGLPPSVGLFQYDSGGGAALTIEVTAILPAEIAAALPGAPGGNGNALALAGLASSRLIDGYTFSEFYGRVSGRVGQDISTTIDEERSASMLLSQSRFLRDQESAVSLDEEAASLIAYQQAYQASAEMVRVVNELTEVVLSLLR